MRQVRRRAGLMLATAVVSLLVGVFFVLLPGHGDLVWRRGIGVVWFVTGAIWFAAYRKRTAIVR